MADSSKKNRGWLWILFSLLLLPISRVLWRRLRAPQTSEQSVVIDVEAQEVKQNEERDSSLRRDTSVATDVQ